MPWLYARAKETCGSCGEPIAAHDPIFVFHPGGFRNGARLVRCLRCGSRTFYPPTDQQLATDTTAPQPSFEATPLERLPNVVSPDDLDARRAAAVARLERWKARHGLSHGQR